MARKLWVFGHPEGGITERESLYEYLDGYKYIEPKKLDVANIDYVIVATEKYFEEVVSEAESIGFHRENILPIKNICVTVF